MLNEFIQKKKQMEVILRNPEEMAKLKRSERGQKVTWGQKGHREFEGFKCLLVIKILCRIDDTMHA